MTEKGVPTPPGYDPPNRPIPFKVFTNIGENKAKICKTCEKELHGKYTGQYINNKMEYFCDNTCVDFHLGNPKKANISLVSCGRV